MSHLCSFWTEQVGVGMVKFTALLSFRWIKTKLQKWQQMLQKPKSKQKDEVSFVIQSVVVR